MIRNKAEDILVQPPLMDHVLIMKKVRKTRRERNVIGKEDEEGEIDIDKKNENVKIETEEENITVQKAGLLEVTVMIVKTVISVESEEEGKEDTGLDRGQVHLMEKDLKIAEKNLHRYQLIVEVAEN